MARKIKDVVVREPGSRDDGKVFRLTEMPSRQGEDWAIRALQIAQRGGTDIGQAHAGGGMAALAALSILSILEGSTSIADLRPLLAEMMSCVEVVTDPVTGHARQLLDDGVNDDIEEIRTRIFLRREWLNLHLDFSVAAVLSTLGEKPTTAAATDVS